MYDDFAGIFPFTGFPQRTSGHGYADDTLGHARKVVSELRAPFFLFIHVHEPHDPYDSPYPIENAATSDSERALLRKFPPALYSYYPRSLQAVADFYRKRYEESIRFLDSELAKFIQFLEANSWSENFLLVFTADHGESFERGYMNHGEELYENSTRIPFIVKFPAQKQGVRVPGLVQSSDIAPTILHTANIPIPAWMGGLPLEPDMPPMGRESIALNFKHPLGPGDTHYPLPTQLAIWWKHYKLIIGCDGARTELYDLDEDQNETMNLAHRERTLVKDLRDRLKSRLDQQPQEPEWRCSLDE
jgi:arylsulfatase A-like enzyme